MVKTASLSPSSNTDAESVPREKVEMVMFAASHIQKHTSGAGDGVSPSLLKAATCYSQDCDRSSGITRSIPRASTPQRSSFSTNVQRDLSLPRGTSSFKSAIRAS